MLFKRINFIHKMNCNFCNNSFKSKAGLTIHIKHCKENPNGINNKVCKYCNKEFSNITNLNFHLEEKHCPEYTKHIEKELEKYKNDIEINNKNHELETNLTKTTYEKKLEKYKNENEVNNKKYEKENKNLQDTIKELEQKNKQLEKDLNDKLERLEEYKMETAKYEAKEQTILTINKNLSAKVGNTNNISNNNYTNNNNIVLPTLTTEKLGQIIDAVNIYELKNFENFGQQISTLGIDQFACTVDKSRNLLILNMNGQNIKDKGFMLSEQIATHPSTLIKKDEIKNHAKQQRIELEYEELSDEKVNSLKSLKEYSEIAEKITNPDAIQKVIPKYLKHKDQINQFTLMQYLNNIISNVNKNSSTLLFGRTSELFFNKYLKDYSKLIVLDDNNKEHRLRAKDIVYILQQIAEQCLTFTKPMSEGEIKAFDQIFKLEIDKNETNRINMESLQKKILAFTTISEDSEIINIILEDIEDGL